MSRRCPSWCVLRGRAHTRGMAPLIRGRHPVPLGAVFSRGVATGSGGGGGLFKRLRLAGRGGTAAAAVPALRAGARPLTVLTSQAHLKLSKEIQEKTAFLESIIPRILTALDYIGAQ
jgi:hypothetical protein